MKNKIFVLIIWLYFTCNLCAVTQNEVPMPATVSEIDVLLGVPRSNWSKFGKWDQKTFLIKNGLNAKI